METYIDTSDNVKRVAIVDSEGLVFGVIRQKKQAFVGDLDAFDERTATQLDGIEAVLRHISLRDIYDHCIAIIKRRHH